MSGNKTVKFLTVAPSEKGLQFILGNERKVEFDLSRVNEAIRKQAELHGFNQKIRDSAAGFSKARDYSGAFAAMADVVQCLYDGDWNRKGGVTGQRMEDLIAAIAKVKKLTPDAVRPAVMKADVEQRKAWAGNAKVALAIAEIERARLQQAATDTDEEEIELNLEG